MDKKSILGLVLIGAVLFLFAWYNNNQTEKYRAEKHIADSIARAEGRLIEPEIITDTPASDSSATASRNAVQTLKADSIRTARLGTSLIAAEHGEEKRFTVENDVMKMTFSNHGGIVTGVQLKDYKTYYGQPLEMYADSTARLNMTFFIRNQYNDTRVDTGDYYFDSVETHATDDGQDVIMRLHVDSLSYLEYVYSIPNNDYMVKFNVNFVNMTHLLSNSSTVSFDWEATCLQNEKGFENENKYTTIAYKYPGGDDVDELPMSKDGAREERVNSSIRWVAFKQQFFSTVFIADNNFMGADVSYNTFKPEEDKLKSFKANIRMAFNKNNSQYGFKFYYGPNKYAQLKTYGEDMERLVPLGWSIVRWVNKYIVIPVFDFLGRHIGSFGLIILLLTLLIKIIILPLTYTSYLSMAKMRVLKPEIDAINEKYPKKEDALKKQQATMDLYKRAGVSPMGGCLPLLIQMPVLVALFYFFPTSIELRGQSFLWADDLSSYDSILNLPFNIPWYGDHISLFTLLMAAAMFLSTKFNPQATGGTQMAGMKIFTYMMPVLFLLWFNNYASGLTYYYFLSNILTMGQTWGFRYIVNDQKLHARMKANAAKKTPKKKSKFQQRYEEMVRQQQQMQQQQRKK
jgi:YidC/Oxa1 family membrane protein insertase